MKIALVRSCRLLGKEGRVGITNESRRVSCTDASKRPPSGTVVVGCVTFVAIRILIPGNASCDADANHLCGADLRRVAAIRDCPITRSLRRHEANGPTVGPAAPTRITTRHP